MASADNKGSEGCAGTESSADVSREPPVAACNPLEGPQASSAHVPVPPAENPPEGPQASTAHVPDPLAESFHFPPLPPGAVLNHSELPTDWQAAVQSLPKCSNGFLEHLEGVTSGSDLDSWQLASAGDREHLVSVEGQSSAIPSDAACAEYEPSLLDDPLRECFENSDAEADYYRRLAGECATVASEPASARPCLEADEGGEVQPARPGAVAESFALDWTRVQDSSLGFCFPWEKGFMKRVFADDRPSLPVLKAIVPPLPSDLQPGVIAQPKAPAWNLKINKCLCG